MQSRKQSPATGIIREQVVRPEESEISGDKPRRDRLPYAGEGQEILRTTRANHFSNWLNVYNSCIIYKFGGNLTGTQQSGNERR
jgi:hypothetical protein